MKTYHSLESLRAYMAWWVVIGHGLQLGNIFKPSDLSSLLGLSGSAAILLDKLTDFFLHGGSAVKVFIILSGFVITHLLIAKQEPFIKYIARRYFRLAPAMMFCIFLAILIEPLYILSYVENLGHENSVARIDRLNEQNANFWIHLFNHLTLIHSIIPQELLPYSSGTFVAPAWSIGLEWQFYILAPFLVSFLSRSQNNIIFISIASVTISFLLWKQPFLEWKHGSFFFLVSQYFLVGILCRISIERLSKNNMPVDIFILVSFLLFIQDPFSSFTWLLFFGLVCYESGYIKIESKIITNVLKFVIFNKFITSVGQISYSTYLVHVPFFSIVIGLPVLYLGKDNVSEILVLLILLFTSPILYFLSALMFKYIEKPPMKFIKKILNS